MKKLTKSEAIFNHRKMWHWMAAETRKQKRKVYKLEYLDFYNISDENKPFGSCYACQYDIQCDNDCTHCPINWGDGMGCFTDGSLYREWLACNENENDWERAAELADKIAELPER